MIHVEPVKDGPDYAPAVTITYSERDGAVEPWETQWILTLELEEARDLWGQLGTAIQVIEINADPS